MLLLLTLRFVLSTDLSILLTCRMAGSSNSPLPGIRYYDAQEDEYRVWTPTLNEDGECLCGEDHTFADSVVRAIELERDVMADERVEFQTRIRDLEWDVVIAREEMAILKAKNMKLDERLHRRGWITRR